MTLELRFAVRSDVGLVREGNEDAGYAGPRLIAVADGMGGHAAGEVASRVAIRSVAALDDDPGGDGPGGDVLGALRGALDRTQDEIRRRVADETSLAGMGTTLTALLWTGTAAGLLHVGDSRAYLLRDGELHQLTHDHTYVQELVDAGELTADQAQHHPQRSLLTRALDGRSAVDPDLSLREVQLGDRYLLCTDGLSGVVPDDDLRTCLLLRDPAAAADELVARALRGGGPDNVTVVVCDVVDDAGPAQPALVGAATDQDPDPDPDAALDPGDAGPRSRRGGGGRPHRLLAVLAGAAALVALGVGGWLWLRSQYFVGVQGDRVTIFRGVSWSVAGLSLHSVAERLAVDPADLPQFERERLDDGIVAASLPQARRVAGRLAAQRCPEPTQVATALPQPAGSPSAAAPQPGSTPCPATPDVQP